MYFKIAERFSIIDKPNNRSSHTGLVIRGGGVIFYMAIVGWFLVFNQSWRYFVIGVSLVAVISFVDDIRPQRASIRFLIHLIAIVLLFYDAGMFHWSVGLLIIAGIISIGTLNAFNFMDGINGITGVYALVNLLTFAWMQYRVIPFSDLNLIIVLVISVFVFLFFNFRKQARCFAGDIGSVTLAYIQIFLLMQLLVATDNFLWVIMFLVFGIDSVLTIIFRLKRKENIFQPHRTHLYQYLSNELKWSHRSVAMIYGTVQMTINVVLIYSVQQHWIMVPIIFAVLWLLIYLIIRHEVVSKVQNVSGNV
jgi:UDP-GlcNAc:undecaprenyl-phosphate/decaprenyl-phosphate GlcNAc-1-phosphate transferase